MNFNCSILHIPNDVNEGTPRSTHFFSYLIQMTIKYKKKLLEMRIEINSTYAISFFLK